MSELGAVAAGTPVGVWAQEVGEGPLVALVHGAMDRSSSMLRVRRALEGECRVLRYDRRGYGRSLATGPSVAFDEQVDDLAGLIGERPAVLAGHSLGGVICLALAERDPGHVRSVLAYEAPMMWQPWWPEDSPGLHVLAGRADGGASAGATGSADAAERFLRRMLGDRRWERLPAALQAERRDEGAALVAELRSVRPPAPPPYTPERVLVPVVAACGTDTSPHHRRAVEELARRAPQGVMDVVDGADHGAHLSHPAAFADLVRHALRLAADGDG